MHNSIPGEGLPTAEHDVASIMLPGPTIGAALVGVNLGSGALKPSSPGHSNGSVNVGGSSGGSNGNGGSGGYGGYGGGWAGGSVNNNNDVFQGRLVHGPTLLCRITLFGPGLGGGPASNAVVGHRKLVPRCRMLNNFGNTYPMPLKMVRTYVYTTRRVEWHLVWVK